MTATTGYAVRLTVVGCSGSFPGPQSPASCYLLQAEHAGRTWSVVIDLGNGSLGVLQRHIDPLALDAIVLTHLHADHFLDICGLYVMQKYHPGDEPRLAIAVHGPADTPERVALAYYGRPSVPVPEFEFRPLLDGVAFHVGPFRFLPRRVEHPVEAYGFRVEVGGRVVAFTGDTDECPQLADLLHGADLALADSAFVDGRDHAPGIHLSGSRAARAAVAAGGVRRLMLTHIPVWNDPEVCRAQAAAVWPDEVEIAHSGLVVEL